MLPKYTRAAGVYVILNSCANVWEITCTSNTYPYDKQINKNYLWLVWLGISNVIITWSCKWMCVECMDTIV